MGSVAMKILLLQLPLQGHDFFFSHENIPLASAGLCLMALESGFDAEVMAEPYMSYGNDRSLLRYIIEFNPDVVGMSCYLWNIERSLFIAREIKRALPSCTVVLGGPEITPDNRFLLRQRDFDLGIAGEGEGTWRSLLRSNFHPEGVRKIPGVLSYHKGRGWDYSGDSPSLPNLAELPSPFLKGALQTHLKDVLWLESVRGCANRCAYCYYHKRFFGIRTFPLTRVLEEIQEARERGLKEVVFLDPCWNRHPRRGEFLSSLLEINRNRKLRLYAECEAEPIDLETARRMFEAGFVEVEIGLQTIQEETHRLIHRRFDPKRFLKGVRALQSSGIEVMIDLIAGLPGEGLKEIFDSLHWVIEQEAYDSLMLYPLSLIPSTELYQHSVPLGLKAMPHPPYLITRTPHLEAGEIHQAFIEYERCMGEDIAPLEMPISFDPQVKDDSFLKGLHPFVRWASLEEVKAFLSIEDRLPYSLTIQLSPEVLLRPEAWVPILKNYLKRNPFSLLSIEVPPETTPDQLIPLWEIVREHTHPLERDYTVPHSPYRSILVLTRFQGMIWKWPDPREWNPLLLFDGQKISLPPTLVLRTSTQKLPKAFLKWVADRYPDPPAIRLWEVPED